MKLENKKQKVVPFHFFLARLSRYGFFCLILVTISIGIGLMGYHFIAHLGLVDSFEMTCMILAGMGPTAELKTNGAKIFSSFYALYSGMAFLTILAIFFAPIIHRLLHVLHVEDGKAEKK